jgi:hypothetical protein
MVMWCRLRNPPRQGTSMAKPLVVFIPHRLGKDEALRRIRTGLDTARANWSHLVTIEQETWEGDRVNFAVTGLGQHAIGSIAVRESEVELAVTLPWLLAKLAEKITPVIRREGMVMLERKR